jgi:hypothetical protein
VQFQNGGEYDFSDEKLQDTFEFSLLDGGTILNHDAGVDKLLSEAIGKPVHLSSQGPDVYEEYWPDLEGLAQRDVVTEEAMPPGTFFDLATIHILIVNILKSHEFDIVQEMSRCSLE